MRRAALAVLVVAAAAAFPASGAADRGLIVGTTEDEFLWRSADAVAVARDLGLQAFRVALPWTRGESTLSASDAERFDALVPAAAGLRIVVTLVGKSSATPNDDASRDDFCATARDLLARYPTIHDVVIWNEPNLGFFWQPQFAPDGSSVAPAAYEALLARCWDVLHAARPSVNVITSTAPSGNDNPSALSNVSHSPTAFIRKLGDAYRLSGRMRRVFDTVGHNPYGTSSAELPWQRHLGPWHIGQGDTDRLAQTVQDAFRGTAQPAPGSIPIWLLEAGYQTVPDSTHQGAYVGRENDERPLADVSAQAAQLTSGIEFAYCQPYVGAFFNFLLWDEPDLARWQSGVLWANGDRKPSYEAARRVTAAVRAGTVDCARIAALARASTVAAADGLVTRIEWPPLADFSVYNIVWRFAIETRSDARYRATIVRSGRPRLLSRGLLRAGSPRTVAFPAQTLPAGRYRMVVVATPTAGSRSSATRRSPIFVVR
jgi:hypothetical protein